MNTLSAEVGLIHGSGFEIIGDTPILSPGSRFNAERAAELLWEGSVDRIICSGRGPVHGEEYRATEAQLMADRLVQMGAMHSRIEIEDQSTSAIGNWVHSVPIIHELGATSVVGVTAWPNISRMQRIGDFVAARSEFELVGYTPSAATGRAKDCARELMVGAISKRFLATHPETPVDMLEEAYETYKERFGIAAVKKFVHRNATTPTDT